MLTQREKVAHVIQVFQLVDVPVDAGDNCYGIYTFYDSKQRNKFAAALLRVNPTAHVEEIGADKMIAFFKEAPILP